MLGADHGHNLNEVFVGKKGAAHVELIHAPLMDYNVCAIRKELAIEIDFRSAEVHLPQRSPLLDIPAKKVIFFLRKNLCEPYQSGC